MTKKILIIDSVNKILPEKLQKSGYEVVDGTNQSIEEIINSIDEYFGLIIRSRFNITADIIDKAKQLRFIARVGSGMESIDIKYCEEKGIKRFNSPEGNRDAVGEHCIGMLLSLLNNLNKADKEVKNGIWKREENRGTEIMGKTVGIIGYGNTGSRFAKKLQGFDCKILAYDKYKSGFGNSYVKESYMEEIFRYSDILSLHIPLTNETQYLVDRNFIEKFEKPFILINSSRGPVVKTKDLVSSLRNSKIIGAALDVIEYEETSFETTIETKDNFDWNYLTKSDKVILSPHIAGWSFESHYKLADILAEKIIQNT